VTAVAERAGLDAAVDTIGAELDRWHVPGVEVAVVRDGETRFAGGLGVRGVTDTTPVGDGTLFHHGSCGKAFTGLLAAVLAAAGTVDLDAPVRRYVPELELADAVVAQRVTLRDLLAHRSGLGRHDFVWILDPSLSRADLVARLPHLPLAGDLRNQWSYSNLGYTLAGHALGRAAGGTWEEALAAHVLEPLGMRRTRSSVAGALADPDHATPHIVRDGVAVETAWREDGSIAPAGGLSSCALDSVRWLLAQLSQTDDLPAEAVQLPHRIAVPVPPGVSPFPELEFHGYGFGWVVGTYRDRPLVWHNGGVDGFTTQTLLLPRDRAGAVVCANQHLTDFSLASVLTIADGLLGVSADESWYDRLDPAPADEADDPVPAQAGPTPPPCHVLADYAGTFRDAGYGELRVRVRDGHLQVRVGHSDLEATHRHYDTWTLRYPALEATFPVTFGSDPDGTIAEAAIPFEEGRPPIRFARVAEATT
jgi:CubicO group peptidase (beta-lactamase class C family)